MRKFEIVHEETILFSRLIDAENISDALEVAQKMDVYKTKRGEVKADDWNVRKVQEVLWWSGKDQG